MKKHLFILSTELIAYLLVAIFVGQFLDRQWEWKGFATLTCVILVYLLWFFKLYKRLRHKL